MRQGNDSIRRAVWTGVIVGVLVLLVFAVAAGGE